MLFRSNAFVGPKVSNYVRRFDAELRKMGVKTGIQLMTSAAGVATPHLDALTAILRQKACNLGLYALAAGANGRADHA